MKLDGCQIPCLQSIFQGYAEVPPRPLRGHLSLALERHFNPRVKRIIKLYANRVVNLFSRLTGRSNTSSAPATESTTTSLKAGDLVRVRSREEIQATLDYWNELKGCAFLHYMWQHCGTTQRVLKSMERFLDERDYHVKKCKGIVLLEGLICHGTPEFGRCDRCCFYFWREEWLEKIN